MISIGYIEKCLAEHKNEIETIESLKTEESRKYTDLQLFILWNYWQIKFGAPPFLSCFDLTLQEYCSCVLKIFGKKSASYTWKKADKNMWNNKTMKRQASDIIETYNRRGVRFLNCVYLKDRTPMQLKYLDDYGKLNARGLEIFKAINAKGSAEYATGARLSPSREIF